MTDICLSCGKPGSQAYQSCALNVAIGVIPDCAAKAAGLRPSTDVKCNWADPTTWNVCLGDPVGKASTGIASPFQGLVSLGANWNTLTSPSTWVRVGLFAFALVLLIVGFLVVSSEAK